MAQAKYHQRQNAFSARRSHSKGVVMLFIDAETVRKILPMSEVISAQEEVFRGLLTHDSIHRGRIDMYVPNDNPDEYYRWGTMEGSSKTLGVHAIRMKSDVMFWPKDEKGDFTTQ